VEEGYGAEAAFCNISGKNASGEPFTHINVKPPHKIKIIYNYSMI
jgi:hypothetical protein